MENKEELMNQNEEPRYSGIESPDEGLKWNFPQCVTCEHNLGKDCAVYKCHRLLAPVDIFNCPSYQKEDTKQ